MTFSESMGLMWRSHVQVVVSELQRIELAGINGKWSLDEIRRQQRAVFEIGAEEFMRRGWVTAEHFLNQAQATERERTKPIERQTQ
jgi:hypothetical protein